MAADAKVLSVGYQRDHFVLWAELDTDASKVPRYFTVYGTGHTMPGNPGTYLGTIQTMGGAFVFHAYEDAPLGETA